MTAFEIGEYLKANGIKQKWLAEKVGIAESRLSSIINGKAPLSAELLFKICKSLGVSSETFRPEEI